MQLGRLDKQTLANKRPKVPPCSGPESTASTGSGTSEAEEWQVRGAWCGVSLYLMLYHGRFGILSCISSLYMILSQAKYERLVDAHKRLQRNNICLEEKLLKVMFPLLGDLNS